MKNNGSNIGAKLVDDFLFATTRYIDQHGKNVFGARFSRAISAPRMKTEALTTAGFSFFYAAAGLPTHALINTLVIPFDMASTWAVHTRSKKNNPPAFYFDTAPDRRIPLTDPKIIQQLTKDRNYLVPKLLGTTIFYSLWAGLTYGIASQIPTISPFAPIFITSSVSVLVGGATQAIGEWWRAGRALSGKWNVLTQKPDPEPVMARSPILSPVPAPAPVRN